MSLEKSYTMAGMRGEEDLIKRRKTGDRKRKQENLEEAKSMHPPPRPQKEQKTHSGINSRKIK